MSFLLSKLLWLFSVPTNLFVLALGLGAALVTSHNRARAACGRRFIVILSCIGLVMLALPLGEWALTPIESHFPTHLPDRVDGIIMLAGDENATLTDARGQPVLGEAAGRYIVFSALTKKYPHARLVFSGGPAIVSPIPGVSNEKVARLALADVGVNPDKVTFEDRSRNTYENAHFSADLIHPQPNENWVLVTSAFHMPRAMGCLRAAGFNVYPAPAGYKTSGTYKPEAPFNIWSQIGFLNYAFHEYLGLVSYWLMGRIESPWP